MVDGNVYRLLSRYFGIDTPINSSKGAKNWLDAKKMLLNETVFSSTKKVFQSEKNWGKKEIIKRNKALSKWAIARWSKGS